MTREQFEKADELLSAIAAWEKTIEDIEEFLKEEGKFLYGFDTCSSHNIRKNQRTRRGFLCSARGFGKHFPAISKKASNRKRKTIRRTMNIKEYLEQKRSKEPLTNKENELYRELCRREKGIK